VAGDLVVMVIGIANAGSQYVPGTPSGWALSYSASAGTGQWCAIYTANYSASLPLTFTANGAVCSYAYGIYYSGTGFQTVFDGSPSNALVASVINGTNSTAMTTGAPTTGGVAGDYEILAYCWTGTATWSAAASGSAIDVQSSNPSAIQAGLGHNTNSNLAANTTVTAFSQTLSASKLIRTGVGLIIKPRPVPCRPD
jgi:hypothetical protein